MKFPYAAFLCIIVSGLCFTVFIVFNYAYNAEDIGLFDKLEDSAEKTMSNKWADWFHARRTNIATGFGYLGIMVLGIAIIITVASGLERKPGEI